MRLLFGMILGACLVTAGAFIHDNWSTTSPSSASVESRPMVNWDVVGENWRVVRQRAREGWTTLSHKVTS